MAANIKDVAKLAGVTISTVSRAFNGYTDIRPQTKARIESAAKTLNYTANISARNLSSKRPPNIGLIMSGLLEGNRRDSGAHLLIQGVFTYALQNHLEVTFYATDSEEQRIRSFMEFCSEHSLSGTILSGISTDDAYLYELIDSSIPCVAIDFPIQNRTSGWISSNNRVAMYEMTRAMIALGHCEILIMAGKRTAAVNAERLHGVVDALREAGITLKEHQVLYADFSEQTAYTAMKHRLKAPDSSPMTCVLCFSDIMAIGVMQALQEAGLRVPQDVSVTGFDDLPISEFTSPPLSSVRQDMRQMGYEGASMLHHMMSHNTDGFHKIIPHELVLRRSSAPIPQKIPAPDLPNLREHDEG